MLINGIKGKKVRANRKRLHFPEVTPQAFFKHAKEKAAKISQLQVPLHVHVHAHTKESKTGSYWVVFAKCVTFVACGISLAVSVLCYILWEYGRGLPDYYFLKNYTPSSITHIYDRVGTQIKTYALEKREFVHLSDIPPRLIHAFISAEDKNFYRHFGIDFLGLLRAVIQNTKHKRWGSKPVGASTITQQVAKIFLVGHHRSFTRKIKEAILAFRLEHVLSKDRILELYLNQIYMGGGSYGVAMAAKTYFGKSLQELTIAECAFLASLPKAPVQHNPYKNPQKAATRRNWVLAQMHKNDIISDEDLVESLEEPLKAKKIPYQNFQANTFFIEEVRRALIQNFGESSTYTAGIEATTTIDVKLQELLEEALRHGLEKYDKRQKWRGFVANIQLDNWRKELQKLNIHVPNGANALQAVVISTDSLTVILENGEKVPIQPNKFTKQKAFSSVKIGDVLLVKEKNGNYEAFQVPEATGGAVVLDANTGEILAMSGGYSFDISQFNCATQAWRQPGSVFKPFVYLEALRQGYSEHTRLVEKPVSFQSGGSVYTPHNYRKDAYGGLMSLYEGLVLSRNVFTIILAAKIGLKRVINTAMQMGVSDYIPCEITSAIGTSETTVLRMARAFAPFFNGGFRVDPTLFLNVTSHINAEKFNLQKTGRTRVIFAKQHLKQMKHMLSGVVAHGTAKRLSPLRSLPIKIYGKTGTSSNFKDAWFVCCINLKKNHEHQILKHKHPLVIAVFIGHAIPRSLGENENGARVAIPVVKRFITKLF